MRKLRNVGLSQKFLLWLLVPLVVSVILHLVTQLLLHRGAPSGPIAIDLANRLSLDAEMSVPSWLAAFYGITAGFIAFFIAKAQGSFYKRLAWYLLAAAAFFISIDEVSALHELLLQDLHAKAGYGLTQTVWDNAWWILLPVIIAGLLVVSAYWYRTIPRRTLVRLIIALGIYLIGAVGVEMASTQVDKGVRAYTAGYVVVEELLEYIGVLLVIRACLKHINEFEPDLKKKLQTIFRTS